MNVRKTELYESFVYDEKDMCSVKDVESGQAAPSWSAPPSQKSHQGHQNSPERKKFLLSRSYDKV